jgi:anti-sigma B factor antagonist
MTITEEKRGSVCILHIEGKINAETDQQLAEKLAAVRDSGANLVINLSEVYYIASSGLRVFLLNLKAYKARGGSFRLANLSGAVAEVFEISGFSSLFEIYPSTEEALGA